jgi:tRNA 2-thiouridine synthesizing protein A
MSEIIRKLDEVKPTTSIEVEGLCCPLPLLRTKKKLAKLSMGDILQINGVQYNFCFDLQAWCERNGHCYLGGKETYESKITFIKKG